MFRRLDTTSNSESFILERGVKKNKWRIER